MKKNSSIMEYIGIFFTIISIIVIIPILLNFVLQCNTPRGKVIGGENSPSVWLDFWGAYLAAIGSTILAIIAVYGNKKTRKQYAMKAEYETAKLAYDNFEKQIINDIKLYSVTKFTTINRLCYENDMNNIIKVQDDLFKELQLSSITIVKYNNDVYFNDYVKLLGIYNNQFLKYSEEVKKLLVLHENNKLSKCDFCQNILNVCKSVNKFCNETDNLSQIGFNILIKKNEEIKRLLQEVNI